MRNLPRPEFVKIDPARVEADLIARYEEKSGKTLYPAQVERLFINLIAYAKSRLDMSIQHAGEQLLVRFATGPILDYLGELVATPRLLAQPARCQLRFSIPAAQTQALPEPAGRRVSTQDGKLTFTSDEPVSIAPGQLQITVSATCLTAGVQGNGWMPGQINESATARWPVWLPATFRKRQKVPRMRMMAAIANESSWRQKPSAMRAAVAPIAIMRSRFISRSLMWQYMALTRANKTAMSHCTHWPTQACRQSSCWSR